jgi:hypothetical protein
VLFELPCTPVAIFNRPANEIIEFRHGHTLRPDPSAGISRGVGSRAGSDDFHWARTRPPPLGRRIIAVLADEQPPPHPALRTQAEHLQAFADLGCTLPIYRRSLVGTRLNAPIVDAARPSSGGLLMVTADGGVFALGDARFYRSMDGRPLSQPVTARVRGDTRNWLDGRAAMVRQNRTVRPSGSASGARRRNAWAVRALVPGLPVTATGVDPYRIDIRDVNVRVTGQPPRVQRRDAKHARAIMLDCLGQLLDYLADPHGPGAFPSGYIWSRRVCPPILRSAISGRGVAARLRDRRPST